MLVIGRRHERRQGRQDERNEAVMARGLGKTGRYPACVASGLPWAVSGKRRTSLELPNEPSAVQGCNWKDGLQNGFCAVEHVAVMDPRFTKSL